MKMAEAVALLAEGVDRNCRFECGQMSPAVALLAEGVDRNCRNQNRESKMSRVALLAEGVDRNISAAMTIDKEISRPPRGGRG